MYKTLRGALADLTSIGISVLLVILWMSICAFSIQKGASYDFKYIILDHDGAFVSSETPTLTILKPPTPTYYNFSTDDWDESEGENTSVTLDEITGLYYHYTFDQPAVDTDPETYGFLVRNTGTYADIQIEEVNYEDIEETVDAIEIIVAAIEVDTQAIETTVAAIEVDTQAIEIIAANVETYVLEMQGSGFNEGTDSLEAIRDRGDAYWGANADDCMGTGDTVVDEDYGGADALLYQTSGAAGIDNATIVAYLTADYNAKNWGSDYIQGISKTDTAGAWVSDLLLDCGYQYTIVFYKQGQYGPNTATITVICP